MIAIANPSSIMEEFEESTMVIFLQESSSLSLFPDELDIISVSDEAKNNLMVLSQCQKIVSFIVIGMNLFLGVFYWSLLFKTVWRQGWGGPPINFMIGNFCFH